MLGEPRAACGLQCPNSHRGAAVRLRAWPSSIPWPREALRGRLIVPVMEGTRQRLTVLKKTQDGVRRKRLANVLYVSLQGRYGLRSSAY
jgi:hypothetical protein